MSKLIQKLERVSQGKVQRIGFGVAAPSKTTPLVLVARLPQANTDLAILATEKGADAVLVLMGNLKQEADTLSRIIQRASDAPLGVSLERATGEEVMQLIEMHCDFLIFGEKRTSSAVLSGEGIGKVVEIDPSLPDNIVRTIDRLPIDAVLLSEVMEGESALTVHQLMLCQRITSLVRKPVVVSVTPPLREGDLEALLETGVTGLLVRMEGDHPGEMLSQMRRAIEALPPLRKKPRERVDVILPPMERVEVPEIDENGE